MNTRNDDLAFLEQGRDISRNKDVKKHRDSLLNMVYEMSKDTHLETLRLQLISAVKLNDAVKIMQIKKKVEDYSRSPQFRAKMAKIIERHEGTEKAEHYYEKNKGGEQ